MNSRFKTMDGNTAAAYVSYAFTEVAAIYPITPSSDMAEHVDLWSSNGKKNIFGQAVTVMEMQSEAGAAGAVHGSLSAGALTTTYTASQGLLLMIPNMYKIAGELLPGVFHVSARALATHALSIFGDHSDIMACDQTGFAMLASGSVQEVMDLAGVAHLSAIKSRIPFLHFFDGFRTSHEIQKIEEIEYDELAKLVDRKALKEFRDRALNPEHPVTRGTNQNPDVFFQGREVANNFYSAVPDTVNEYMEKITEITGRKYAPFVYYGAEDAEDIIISMGSSTSVIEETIDYLNKNGYKVGLIKVHLYRPFSEKYFFQVFPQSVKRIAVMDRSKDSTSLGEALYKDIKSMFYDREEQPIIIGGRYGLGSKDFTSSQVKAIYDNLAMDSRKKSFTVGIIDDVTNTSIEVKDIINTEPEGTKSCKFWGLGSDGTVGANKDAIKIIGDNTDLYAQGYFSYDSKKSGGVTVSHLRFGKDPIKSSYLINSADYIGCHNHSYLEKYDVVEDLAENGVFVLNTFWTKDQLEEKIPNKVKKVLAQRKARFYIINAAEIARKVGLGNRLNMIMQTVFFKLAEVMPLEESIAYLKDAIVKSYGNKGEKVVEMNHNAVDQSIDNLIRIDIPKEWAELNIEEDEIEQGKPKFVLNIADKVNALQGDKLPVSAFVGREDGTIPPGTAAFEKRAIALFVPEWLPENCIQCGQCSFVCPHATIRPFLLNEEEKKNAPETFKTVKANGKQLEGLDFKIQVSTLDCTGCMSCAEVCPAPKKALQMKPIDTQTEAEIPNWEYAVNNVSIKDNLMKRESIKGSQLAQPLVEFSGACAGCGETPYVKLITQLFGDKMYIANATGCSSIWGAAYPSSPYTVNSDGHGPAWSNSLFEDNAEFGLGMLMANSKLRESLQIKMHDLLIEDISEELKVLVREWLENFADKDITGKLTPKLKELFQKENNPLVQEIMERSDFLAKKSHWVFGGDGWAYDIGFGGLDHVIATGEDINIFVYDTEVYSNTGGQASKSTPAAAVAKFAASGKKSSKKDLGLMATVYGNVYVAQIALGANMNQAIKAIKEAESYPGPSLIIAYSTCINHGIVAGMGTSMERMKKAVEAGYWHLWRYNPLLKEEGKNPFILDSKEPTGSFVEFLMGEVRYSSLFKTFPHLAENLFKMAEDMAKEKYENYARLLK